MGTRAHFSGPQGANLTMELFIKTVSQSVERNETVVEVWATVAANSVAYFYQPSSTITMRINGGGEMVKPAVNVGRSSKVTFYRKRFTIPHNADGKKEFGYDITLDTNFTVYGKAYAQATYRPADIPRASNITASNAEVGGVSTIKISRYSNSFKHDIKFSVNGWSGTVATKIDTDVKWTVPDAMIEHITTSDKATVTVTADTYLNSTKIGSKSTTIQVTVPGDVKPTAGDLVLTEIDSKIKPLVLPENVFVQNLSKVQINHKNSSGARGSTIKNLVATIKNGASASGVNSTLNFPTAGDIAIDYYVTDSRNRKSPTKTLTVKAIEYFLPILNFKVDRTGDAASTLTITRNAKVAPILANDKQNNTLTLNFKVTDKSDGSIISDTGDANVVLDTVAELVSSSANLANVYSPLKSFRVQGTLSDAFGGISTFTVDVPFDEIIVSYSRDGVGILKPREKGAVDVKGDVYINGDVYAGQYKRTSTPYSGNGDFDTFTSDGIFKLGDSAKNSPASGTFGMLEVIAFSGTEVIQRYTTTTARVFVRERPVSGVWRPWYELNRTQIK